MMFRHHDFLYKILNSNRLNKLTTNVIKKRKKPQQQKNYDNSYIDKTFRVTHKIGFVKYLYTNI